MLRITDAAIQPFEQKHTNLVRRLAPEGVIMLKRDGRLPFSEPSKIAVYGSGARKTIRGGTGSGEVNVRHFVTIEEGLEKAGFVITSKDWLDAYDQVRAEARTSFIEEVKEVARKTGTNPALVGMGRTMTEPEYDIPLCGEGSKAIYVVARNSGEGADRKIEPGDMYLSETEIRDILAANEKYENFVLVLNVGGMVDLSQVKDVKNIMLLGQLGTPTGDVLADLLLGKSYPSGKLAMTWASLEKYPSTREFGGLDDTFYKEGIYVGYRYFDTFNVMPDYPFGFGLGYTDFKIEIGEFAANEKDITVDVAVTNCGHHVGKEVVQVYVSKPEGVLDQPFQELISFAKTKELKPEETQVLQLCFPTTLMASYDISQASYVLEKGEYIIRVGNCSDDTTVCGILVMDGEAVISKVKNICPEWGFDDLRGCRTIKSEKFENMPRIYIHSDKVESNEVSYNTNETIPDIDDAVRWDEVISGLRTLDEFVGSLSLEELIYLCLGYFEEDNEAASIVGNACVSIAGAAGETTRRLREKQLPSMTMADGPAGIRVSEQYKIVGGKPKGLTSSISDLTEFFDEETLKHMAEMELPPTPEELVAKTHYIFCVAIPIGTTVAQTWSMDVAEQFGDIVGSEMQMFGINFWLAPAMNIQRSPICGRNFEYFSEDPLISGRIGGAITKGVQKHEGCAATLKHFVCNNQETNRFSSNSAVSERALREIYLKGFEICVKESQPHAIMSAYNLVNKEHICNRKELITDVLRSEWKFKGIVMTDWFATQTYVTDQSGRKNKYPVAYASGCIKAGNDLCMPGGKTDFEDILNALQEQNHPYHLSIGDIQRCAKRILQKIQCLGGSV